MCREPENNVPRGKYKSQVIRTVMKEKEMLY